jgi:hypothetical protein
VKPVTLPSRLGPRHWGQSCPGTLLALTSKTQTSNTPNIRYRILMTNSVLFCFRGGNRESLSLVKTPQMTRSSKRILG